MLQFRQWSTWSPIWTLLAAMLPLATVCGAPPPAPKPPIPPDYLPRYQMQIEVDTGCRFVRASQTVAWTNPGAEPTDEIWFHVYPRHRPTKEQLVVYERTLESFRLNPRTGIDKEGRRLRMQQARSGDAELDYCYDAEIDTVLRVKLPAPVNPGETVEVSLDFELTIPELQGRFGRWKGITNLLNWYPLVAYYGENGWDAPPYVAWHQPFFNEAGHYDVRLTIPRGEILATSGEVLERFEDDRDRQQLHIVGSGLREFSMVLSKRFEVLEEEIDGIRVQVYSLPDHRFYARQAMQTARECLPLYNRWFGRYPHKEFKIAEAHFGWNGNETSGMVLIDERVFDAPTLGHIYVDSLISHEICHQWWYSVVGTDGFRETWMDEGLVSHLTQVRMEQKYGAEAELLDWPKGLEWLPNINYRSFVHNGYYLYMLRGGKAPVLGPLPDMGNVHYLFFLAYDRGNKIFEMLHHRIGDELFFTLLRHLYSKYGYRIMFVDDFQSELEAITGDDWTQFFDDWLRSSKIADWKIDKVKVQAAPHMTYETHVDVVQQREIDEPVNVAIWTGGKEPLKNVALIPEADAYLFDGVSVEKVEPGRWRMRFASAERPSQIIVDPEQRVLDADLKNNRWKPEPKVELTPLYTPLNEIPIVHPLDRVSIVAGPNVDEEGRFGLRGSFNYMHRYRVSPFIAYTHRDAHTTVGVDARVFNVPFPNFSIGARYEHTLLTGLFDDPMDQGRVYLRWHQAYTTSFLFEDLAYLDVYFRFGDNFFPLETFRRPTDPRAEVYRDIRAVGVNYRVNTQMPYWNPEQGFALDVAYEHGFVLAGTGETYDRVWGQASAVRRLKSAPGYLSETRVAGRVAGGVGSPDHGQHFRFGGPLRFRGQRSEDTLGSLFWLASGEYRFPIVEEIDWQFVDNLASWKSLYGSIFYDVGESYLFGRSQGVDHAVGAGLYFQISLVSFLEQLTMRVEYGHSLKRGSNVAWFGLYQAF